MIKPILAGTETEYGFSVEGRGAEDQIDDAIALVRSYPDECFFGWDYRYESPRADLRGFRLDRLAQDPEDAKFDRGRSYGKDQDVRSDRIMPNGARFYNDHGHPEYSTPECWSLDELMEHDANGEFVVLQAARAYAEKIGKEVRVYKNNTDFHGASYGSHESYLVPRSLGWESIYEAVLPMLVVRQILTGAGKVGSESGPKCDYQISQRADFFVEPINTETLFRRPIFNTRDEPHADPREWMRLHVISGDANMMRGCTRRKVGLVKLAIHLCIAGTHPSWTFKDPVRAFQEISRDASQKFGVRLGARSWTTAAEIFESYFAAAQETLDLDWDMKLVIDECQTLLRVGIGHPHFEDQVDWAKKKAMLDQFIEQERLEWNTELLQAYDLEYHNIDPDLSLFHAMGHQLFEQKELWPNNEDTRARARGLAVSKFKGHLKTASWSSLTFDIDGKIEEVELRADTAYPSQLEDIDDVGTFISTLRSIEIER